jgi:NADH:ubiquinone oxidoreductase subunit 4 (subunit M)
VINVLLWAPLAFGLIGLLAPRRLAGGWGALGALVALGLAIGLVADFDSGSAGLQHTVQEPWISGLGVVPLEVFLATLDIVANGPFAIREADVLC